MGAGNTSQLVFPEERAPGRAWALLGTGVHLCRGGARAQVHWDQGWGELRAWATVASTRVPALQTWGLPLQSQAAEVVRGHW